MPRLIVERLADGRTQVANFLGAALIATLLVAGCGGGKGGTGDGGGGAGNGGGTTGGSAAAGADGSGAGGAAAGRGGSGNAGTVGNGGRGGAGTAGTGGGNPGRGGNGTAGNGTGNGGRGGNGTAGNGTGNGGRGGNGTAGNGTGNGGRGGAGAGGLGGTSSASCPGSEPRRFDPGQRQNYDVCSSVGSVCHYGNDCCSCVSNATCASETFWWCVTPAAGCPAAAPAQGTACSMQGLTCVYCDASGTFFQLCNAGSWAGRNALGCT